MVVSHKCVGSHFFDDFILIHARCIMSTHHETWPFCNHFNKQTSKRQYSKPQNKKPHLGGVTKGNHKTEPHYRGSLKSLKGKPENPSKVGSPSTVRHPPLGATPHVADAPLRWLRWLRQAAAPMPRRSPGRSSESLP